MDSKLYMVFDVESVGLHGEGFAVGWVVIRDGKEIASACYACNPDNAKSFIGAADNGAADRAWVAENVKELAYNERGPAQVRNEFWEAWEYAKKRGAQLVSDCAWPVEANFLSACIADNPKERAWDGPYPLLDVSSILLAAGKDPVGTFERKQDELPAHNPLCDARQSARVFIETLKHKSERA